MKQQLKKAYASEGTHWYASPETCRLIGHLYEPRLVPGAAIEMVPSSDGKSMVRGNVTHARKYFMVPGVTGPLGYYAKDALMDWTGRYCAKMAYYDMRDNGMLQNPDEAELSEWTDRMLEAKKAKVKEDAAGGTLIHAACEQVLLGESHDHKWNQWIVAMQAGLEGFGDINWRAEESFYNELGFGGRTDLFNTEQPRKLCGDIKTREHCAGSLSKARKSSGAGKPLTWNNYGRLTPRETEPMQIAANMKGWGMDLETDIGFNLYLDRDDPDVHFLVIYTPGQLCAAWECFKALHRIFFVQRGLTLVQ